MMDRWEDVAGLSCQICGGPATHHYGYMIICCDCHAGKDNGCYNRADAEAEHARVLARRANNVVEGGQ